MISLLLIFPTYDILAVDCFGEFHQGIPPDRVSIVCPSEIAPIPHKPIKVKAGSVTVKIDGTLYRSCAWGTIDFYTTDAILVLTCPA